MIYIRILLYKILTPVPLSQTTVVLEESDILNIFILLMHYTLFVTFIFVFIKILKIKL